MNNEPGAERRPCHLFMIFSMYTHISWVYGPRRIGLFFFFFSVYVLFILIDTFA